MSNPFSFLKYIAVLTILILLSFFSLKYVEVPTGSLLDWIIGVSTFIWLTAITVIPWNMYFAAKDVLFQYKTSKENEIKVNPDHFAFASKISRIYFVVAISLHLVSALILFLLSYYNVTSIGYISSMAALLLTLFRPLFRLNEHILNRLSQLNQEIHYPRDDVKKLLVKLKEDEARIRNLEEELNRENEYSWAFLKENEINELKKRTLKLETDYANLFESNKIEHEQLTKHVDQQITKLSEDAQFLNQVRDLIRFIKNAK